MMKSKKIMCATCATFTTYIQNKLTENNSLVVIIKTHLLISVDNCISALSNYHHQVYVYDLLSVCYSVLIYETYRETSKEDVCERSTKNTSILVKMK